MAVFPAELGAIRDRAIRECLKRVFETIDPNETTWTIRWADRDDANLLDASGDYSGQTVSLPANITRALLRASHNCSDVTFELQELS